MLNLDVKNINFKHLNPNPESKNPKPWAHEFLNWKLINSKPKKQKTKSYISVESLNKKWEINDVQLYLKKIFFLIFLIYDNTKNMKTSYFIIIFPVRLTFLDFCRKQLSIIFLKKKCLNKMKFSLIFSHLLPPVSCASTYCRTSSQWAMSCLRKASLITSLVALLKTPSMSNMETRA